VAILATPIINGGALWKIVLASALGGIGVVIAFGLLVLFVTRAEQVRATHGGERILYLLGSAVCGAFCLAVVVIGIYAMAKKPATPKPKATKASAPTITRPLIRRPRAARAAVAVDAATTSLRHRAAASVRARATSE
jgi:hypothetical protein